MPFFAKIIIGILCVVLFGIFLWILVDLAKIFFSFLIFKKKKRKECLKAEIS